MIPSKLLRSSTFRLALVYMAVFFFSVLVLVLFLYIRTTKFMDRQIDDVINSELLSLQEQYGYWYSGGLIRSIRKRMAEESNNFVYLVTDLNYNPLMGNIDAWPSAEISGEDNDGWFNFVIKTENNGVQSFRARQALLTSQLGDIHAFVALNIHERKNIQQLLIQSLGYGLGITILLGLAGGLLVSRSALRRLDVINRACKEIMDGGLGRRIPTRDTNDEFDRLTQNLNAMLDQIERLMIGIKQVSDNIAHDLRSPLNRMRGRLEMALLEQPDVESSRRAIEQTIEESDELLTTFNALLKIARAEAGSGRENFTPLDLTTLTQDMAELYEPLAEDKKIHLTTDLAPNVTVSGNRQLLSQAIANLLDNAVKYTPPHGRIQLLLKNTPEGPQLAVTDTGPGIPPQDREKVLERFHRLESSRSAPGSGLGLSLVAAVAILHGATLTFSDNRPGLRASLAFTNSQ